MRESRLYPQFAKWCHMRNRTPLNKAPRRLIDSLDLGPLIREATSVAFDEDRLASNRAKLMKQLHNQGATAPGWLQYALVGRRRTAVAISAILFMVSAGATAVIYIQTVIRSASEIEKTDVHKERAVQKRARSRKQAMVDTEIETNTEKIDAANPTENQPNMRIRTKRDSTLDAQVTLFNKAKAKLKSGDPKSALEHLKRLRQRYPTGPLTLESKELRAHALADLRRYKEASNAIKSLVNSKISTRKKAQLYRFLGDLEVKQNRCTDATESYRRALGLGLSGPESSAARAGIRKCTP